MYRRLSSRKRNVDSCCVVVVHCYAIKNNIIVASQLDDVADVQFTVEKQGPAQILQFIKKYTHAKSVPNIVIMLRIFLTIAVSVATCERSFAKLKLIKNYLRPSISTLRLRYLATLSIEQQLTDEINFDIAIEEFANNKVRKVIV